MESIAIGPARVHSKVPAEPPRARHAVLGGRLLPQTYIHKRNDGKNLAINLSYKLPIVIINQK